VKATPKLALFEVGDGVFTEGNVFGEEIVEVVTDEGVVDSTCVAQGAENEECDEEVAEAAAWFLWWWWWRC
jgi:hypothetical protein